MNKKVSFLICFIFFFFLNISFAMAEDSGKTILLVAAHGLGKDCNHASITIGGTTYYENQESRKLINKIAGYLDEAGMNYEIANQIVGDAYWDSNPSVRQDARNCNVGSSSTCCGYRTATIGTYSSTLLSHVDTKGIQNYSMVFELHFNAGKGNYTVGLGRDYALKENNLKIAQAVVDTIGVGNARFEIDQSFLNMKLGTISNFYIQRSIPTYYLETVFMDNVTQFQAFLDHQDEVAQALASVIIEIAPNSKGGYPNNSNSNSDSNSSSNSGRYIDPYPNIFSAAQIDDSEDVGCDTIFFDDFGNKTSLKEFLDDLFFIIRLSTPILVIVLSTLDYLKALFAQDDSKIKQSHKRMMQRVMIGLCVFFLPYFLDLLFHLFGLYDLSRCGIG